VDGPDSEIRKSGNPGTALRKKLFFPAVLSEKKSFSFFVSMKKRKVGRACLERSKEEGYDRNRIRRNREGKLWNVKAPWHM
jgi:hypothetical protein